MSGYQIILSANRPIRGTLYLMRTETAQLPDKRPGQKSRLDDPEYRAKLVSLYPVCTTEEVARALDVTARTVRRHVAQIKQEGQAA